MEISGIAECVKRSEAHRHLAFEMNGGRKPMQLAGGHQLDGGLRAHRTTA
jgi:hypothetical protein